MPEAKTRDEKIEPRLGDEIPKDWIKKAEKEIKAKYREVILDEFRDKKDVRIHIFQTTSGVDGKSTDAYARAFNRLIDDPTLKTRKQMENLLSSRGIWGEDQEKQIESIRESMRDVELSVAKMRKNKKYNRATMNRLRKSWMDSRSEITDLLSEKNAFLANTVEGRAEEEEVKVKLFLCVKNPDGTLVWNTIEELNDETDKVSVVRLVSEAMLFWAGLTQEIIDYLPTEIFGGGGELEK